MLLTLSLAPELLCSLLLLPLLPLLQDEQGLDSRLAPCLISGPELTSALLRGLPSLQDEMDWATESTPSHTSQLEDMMLAAQQAAVFGHLYPWQQQLLSTADWLEQLAAGAVVQLSHQQLAQLRGVRHGAAFQRTYPLQGDAQVSWFNFLEQLRLCLDSLLAEVDQAQLHMQPEQLLELLLQAVQLQQQQAVPLLQQPVQVLQVLQQAVQLRQPVQLKGLFLQPQPQQQQQQQLPGLQLLPQQPQQKQDMPWAGHALIPHAAVRTPGLHYVEGSRQRFKALGLTKSPGPDTPGVMAQIVQEVAGTWHYVEQLAHAVVGDPYVVLLHGEEKAAGIVRSIEVRLAVLGGTAAADALKQQLQLEEPDPEQWGPLVRQRFEQIDVPDGSKTGGTDQAAFDKEYELPLIKVKSVFYLQRDGLSQNERGHGCTKSILTLNSAEFKRRMCQAIVLQVLAWKLQEGAAAERPAALQQLLLRLPQPVQPGDTAATRTQQQQHAVITGFVGLRTAEAVEAENQEMGDDMAVDGGHDA
jgi:hypothetical protein